MRIPPSPPFSKGGTSPVPAQAELDFTTTPPFEKGGPGGIPAHQGARMTAAWMENLELLAEAPGGVGRLRGLIRDLAVTGKLLPKESSVVAWTWSTLGEQVSGMDSGWSPACLDTPSPAPEVWGVLRTTAVQSLRYIQEENKELPTHLAPRPEAEVMPGDVLFTRAGPMNRVGISCLVASTRPRLMLSDKIIRFRPKAEKLDGRFTALCLNAGVTADYLERAKSGMAASQVNISQAKLKAAPIPLPPLPEQHRIVAKVDELMTLCDRLEARQADAQHAHARLVQALLDSLTQARDAEEFQAAWERVAGCFEGVFSTENSVDDLRQVLLQLAIAGKLVRSMTAWKSTTLGSLGTVLGGATPSKANPAFWSGDIPWVSPKDMKRPLIDDAADHISPEAIESSPLKLIPVGSLLMVVRGMILAHSFPVALTTRPVTINQDMKALSVPKELAPYLLLYLQASKNTMVGLVDRSSHGTCKLVSEKLWSLQISLPPLEEQARILAKVTELLALCDQLKARIVAARAKQAQLAEALVKQAVATAAG